MVYLENVFENKCVGKKGVYESYVPDQRDKSTSFVLKGDGLKNLGDSCRDAA